MTGFSPPPPPQAARAFVRQIFGGRRGRPEVVATLLDDADSHVSSLEFLNEGGPANAVECLAQIVGRTEHVAVGSLGPGEVKSVALAGPLPAGDFRCVWACTDANRGTYVWSYDGQRRHLRRSRRAALDDLFRELYPQ